MSEPPKAVFLSYASQDAVAVAKICDALRALGVEVWFDQNELVGGDAWDQKIRKQIKECALFVPVISANTNARAEGYFRLEWKLAVDRSHLMADDAAFLFPVVIDDTSDAAARVPDKFREVQWTRLNVKDTPETLAARVAKLLGGGGPSEIARAARRTDDSPAKKSSPGWMRYAWAIFGLVMGLFWMIRPLWNSGGSHEKKPSAVPPAASSVPTAAPLSEARQLVARARALSLDKYDSTAEDFAAAEVMVKRALELDPNDAEVWILSSHLNFSYGSRGFDHAPSRIATARSHAERALSLAPASLEALYALARWQRDNEEPAIAEATFKKILAREPNHTGALGGLAWLYDRTDRADESAALYERVVTLPGANPALTRYTEFLLFFRRARFEEAERCIRQSIEIQPSANSQAGLALLSLTAKGDADGAARVLASGATAVRSEPRTIWTTAVVQLCQRKPDDVLKTLDRFSADYIQDNWFAGPPAFFAGMAHTLAGRKTAARLAWESGLAVVDARLKAASQNVDLHGMRGELLALLGRADEALTEANTVLELSRQSDRYLSLHIYALLGRADDAIPVIAEQLERTRAHKIVGWPLTSALLRLDPMWDKLRDDPRFQKLCTEPAADEKKGVAAPLTEAAKLTARVVALYSKLNYTREDLATAEELARKATELEPDSATAWGARAGVHSTFVYRNWDQSQKRLLETQTAISRALGLDPNEPEALLTQGRLLSRQGPGVAAQTEATLKRALALRPDDNRYVRALAVFYATTGRTDDERALLRGALQRDARDPLVYYDLAASYANFGPNGTDPRDVTTALELLDTGIAVQPITSLLILKAGIAAGRRGDLAAMRGALDQLEKLSIAERAEDRAVFIAMWGALLERKPDRVVAAAGLTAKNYFDDGVVPRRPKDWTLATAHHLDGKENLARLDWQRAELAVRQHQHDDPNTQVYAVELATTLAGLGKLDEAAREVAPVEAAWREELTPVRARALAFHYAVVGDAAKAAPYVQRGLNSTAFFTAQALRLDPWWDKLRGSPEFEALLKEPAAKK